MSIGPARSGQACGTAAPCCNVAAARSDEEQPPRRTSALPQAMAVTVARRLITLGVYVASLPGFHRQDSCRLACGLRWGRRHPLAPVLAVLVSAEVLEREAQRIAGPVRCAPLLMPEFGDARLLADATDSSSRHLLNWADGCPSPSAGDGQRVLLSSETFNRTTQI